MEVKMAGKGGGNSNPHFSEWPCIYYLRIWSGVQISKLGDNYPTNVYENKVMKNHHGGVIKVGEHLVRLFRWSGLGMPGFQDW